MLTALAPQVIVQAETQDDDKWYGRVDGIPVRSTAALLACLCVAAEWRGRCGPQGLDVSCCRDHDKDCSCDLSQNITNTEAGAGVVFTATNKK